MIETTGTAGLRRRRFLRLLGLAGAATAAAGLDTACGSARPADTGDGSTIRIGYLTPATGALAPFGAADRFVIEAMREHYARNPLVVGGRPRAVEIVDRDTQSSADRAADLAADLIAGGGIHLMLAAATPATTIPVSDLCETAGMPCLCTGTLWQPWFFGRAGRQDAPFRWTYNFFWGLSDVEAVYTDMWNTLRTNKACVGLWPDDQEGRSWGDPTTGFPSAPVARSYDFVDAGAYRAGAKDFTRLITTFRARTADVLVGVPELADFTTFWKQAAQQGFRPRIATIGRALLFPSGVEALGRLAEGLGTEVGWSPRHPYSSSLTGQTAQQLADAYTTATGQQWIQPLGFAHALFEVATAAFAGVTAVDDRAGLAAAIGRTRLDTVVGPLDWTSGPVPNVATTPLVGGQWRAGVFNPFELVIVSNDRHPEIPVADSVIPLTLAT